MTSKQILTEIRRLAKAGKAMNITAVKRHSPHLLESVYASQPFVGWKGYLEAAGIDYRRIPIEIEGSCRCCLCGEEHKILTTHIGSKLHRMSVSDYKSRFPEAELVSESVRVQKMKPSRVLAHWEPLWSKEYILDRLHEYEKRGWDIHYQAVSDRERSFATTVIEFFGSWDNALVALSHDPETVRKNPSGSHLSRCGVVELLRRRELEKKPLNYAQVEKCNPQLVNAARRRFGSYRRALIAAEINPSRVQLRPAYYTGNDKKLVVQEVRRIAKLRGSERYRAALRLHKNFNKIVQSNRHWRTWRRVAEVAGVSFEKIRAQRFSDRESVIEWLDEHVRKGKSIKPGKVFKEDRGLYTAVRKHFGDFQSLHLHLLKKTRV